MCDRSSASRARPGPRRSGRAGRSIPRRFPSRQPPSRQRPGVWPGRLATPSGTVAALGPARTDPLRPGDDPPIAIFPFLSRGVVRPGTVRRFPDRAPGRSMLSRAGGEGRGRISARATYIYAPAAHNPSPQWGAQPRAPPRIAPLCALSRRLRPGPDPARANTRSRGSGPQIGSQRLALLVGALSRRP